MADRMHHYRGEQIDVSYDAGRCIHAAECVRRLAAVFDTSQRPWVQPDNADADAVAAAIARCPSGALRYTRHDGGTEETPDAVNRVTPQPNGPLYARGDIEVHASNGELIAHGTRVALCRCGHSANKPFCDNSHRAAGFQDPGAIGEKTLKPADQAEHTLVVTPTENGPLQLRGPLEICDVAGETCRSGGLAYLCRCGGSGNKPFCDGTHSKIGFQD
ncbi:MAG TPA: CDGSH iron-sulfur domain-containing protein [Kouleothrix sp.]|nr:CDGSH iron-sulfur domain-containing protein [Kouleothrix sp.]